MTVYTTVLRVRVDPKSYEEGFRGLLQDLQQNLSGAIDVEIRVMANDSNVDYLIKQVAILRAKRYLYQYTGDLVLNSLYALKRSHHKGVNVSFELRSKYYDLIFIDIITDLMAKVEGDYNTELTIPLNIRDSDYAIMKVSQLYAAGYIDNFEKRRLLSHLTQFKDQLKIRR